MQSSTKCGSKTNYSHKAFMSFFNFPSATSTALMDFSYSIFVFRKEFTMASNVKFSICLCINAIFGYI